MSDSTTFINAYVDNAVGLVHDYINQILQLKTENKLAMGLVKEKDEALAKLQEELDRNRNESENWHKSADDVVGELDQQKDKYKKLEEECNALKNKASHLDSMASQLTNCNREMSNKNEEIRVLNEKIAELTSKCDETSSQLTSKVSEIDNLNNVLKSKDDTIQKLTEQLSKSESPSVTKTINNKGKTLKSKPVVTEEPDDF